MANPTIKLQTIIKHIAAKYALGSHKDILTSLPNITITFIDNVVVIASDHSFLYDWLRVRNIDLCVSETIICEAKILFEEKLNKNIELQIWDSNKIAYAYLVDNYVNKCGPLGDSCMRHKHMQKALNFYIKNNVKIVVATQNNKILARALLWEDIKTVIKKKVKSITYLDRIYYNSDKIKVAYKTLATKNNWYSYHWNKQSILYKEDIILTGITHLPYTDTFRFLCIKEKLLFADSTLPRDIPSWKKEKYISLTTTAEEGYRIELDKNAIKEVFTKHWMSKKDGIYIAKYRGYVHRKNLLKFGDVYYSIADSTNIRMVAYDTYALKENIVTEIFTEVEIDKTKAIYIQRYKGFVHNTNTVKIKQEQYSKFDSNVVEYKDTFILKSKCFKTFDNKYVPKYNALILYDFDRERPILYYCNICNTLNTFSVQNIPIKCQDCKESIDWNKGDVITPEFNVEYIIDKNDLKNIEHIKLNTGELILRDKATDLFLKKHNNKWYLKKNFVSPDKQQLLFTFK